METFRNLRGYIVFNKDAKELPSDFSLQVEQSYLNEGIYIEKDTTEFRQETNILKISICDSEDEDLNEDLTKLLEHHGALFCIYCQEVSYSSVEGRFYDGPNILEFKNPYPKKSYTKFKKKIKKILNLSQDREKLEYFIDDLECLYNLDELFEKEILTKFRYYLDLREEDGLVIIEKLARAIYTYDPSLDIDDEDMNKMVAEITEILK